MPTSEPATNGVACSRSAYAGKSGITIPKPIRSMKTVRKRTNSGERRRPDGDTSRGNPKGAYQSSEDTSRRRRSLQFDAEPAQTPHELSCFAQQSSAEARIGGVAVTVT